VVAAVVGACLIAAAAGGVVLAWRRWSRDTRPEPPTEAASPTAGAGAGLPLPRPALPATGVDPSGAALSVAARTDGDLLLAFLTSTCVGCRPFWEGLASGGRPRGLPVVVVTPDPTLESAAGVASLADGLDLTVVMSSGAWLDYRVRAAPWFVVVAAGLVVAEGQAASWEELGRLAGVT